ncbi:MAG: hypothetical protein WAV20_11515 [Blastocatellia bacterium]
MKTITRFGSIVAAFALLSTLGLAAPKAERAKKYFSVTGTVVQIDTKEHTLLVENRSSNKLYFIEFPEGASFKITFGRYMRMAEPGLNDVFIRDKVEVRCSKSDTEHLARLQDGRQVIALRAQR